jgi:hypothetical protein
MADELRSLPPHPSSPEIVQTELKVTYQVKTNDVRITLLCGFLAIKIALNADQAHELAKTLTAACEHLTLSTAPIATVN